MSVVFQDHLCTEISYFEEKKKHLNSLHKDAITAVEQDYYHFQIVIVNRILDSLHSVGCFAQTTETPEYYNNVKQTVSNQTVSNQTYVGGLR